jgi:teichoic acid transport system permease protein
MPETEQASPDGPSPSASGGAPGPLVPAELAARYGLSRSTARPSLPEYVRQLWERRHFILAFATARNIATYTASRLGQLWQVLTPLLNAAVYYLLFGLLLETDRGVENYPAFLVTGVFVFTFTQSSVQNGARSIIGNLALIRALHFPRACLPLSFTLVEFQQLLISMGVLVGVVLLTGEPITVAWVTLIPALVLLMLFNIGLSLVMARIGARIQDVTQLLPFLTRTWFYTSGVFYSIDHFTRNAPDAVRTILSINPAAVYIDLFREALLEQHDPIANAWWLGAGWAIVAIVGGFVYFWRAEETYGRG